MEQQPEAVPSLRLDGDMVQAGLQERGPGGVSRERASLRTGLTLGWAWRASLTLPPPWGEAAGAGAWQWAGELIPICPISAHPGPFVPACTHVPMCTQLSHTH